MKLLVLHQMMNVDGTIKVTFAKVVFASLQLLIKLEKLPCKFHGTINDAYVCALSLFAITLVSDNGSNHKESNQPK